ncbi:GAF domain-containing protein [uncultured Jatrophihabitans sp.]|uniref:GAF domain-containing sensor histidine kinase n=1 Tax=uncultured Jatrophihabitans sp. TaxID=1610747 RepID=UPI0035CC361F
MDVQPGAALQFPDATKLELDALIEQLVDRARDVQRSQGRLRGLLRAIETLTADPSLDAVLLNVVAAACTLVEARYGALGVIGPNNGLEQCVYVSNRDADGAVAGQLPAGCGLRSAVVQDPHATRFEENVIDARSAGYPPSHPPMDSFLVVAVRVHGELYGNLYLTDSAAGKFSAEDKALAGALALAAGTAISNAHLLEESRLQQRWLAASVEISSQLTSELGDDPLDVVARSVIEIADADLVTVSLLTPGAPDLMVEAAAGHGASDLLGRRFPVATSRVRSTLELGTPVLLPQDDTEQVDDDSVPDTGPIMGLPLDGAHGVRGVLSVIRGRGRRPFHATDLAMATSFAGHASVALELADARQAAQELARSEERERIARNLHDHVIQELFAIGLSLETTATFVEPGGVAAQRIAQRVRDIDRTIRQIRTSIFELRGPLGSAQDGSRAHVLQIAAELSEALGFMPQVVFSGLVDFRLDANLAQDLYACVREVLTNIAKHAHASRADIDLSVTPTSLSLVVSDDGIGYTPTGRLSGLANLRVRAERRSGSFDISSAAGRGTIVTWKASL